MQQDLTGIKQAKPRLLKCRRYEQGYLVETATVSWLIASDDEEGFDRLGAMIRMELNGRTAGNC